MRWIKIGLLALVLGITSYFLSLNIFTSLKVQGYSYLFRAKEPYDLVVKHALILDGSGINGKFRGDIAIRDGCIVGVGYVNPKDSPVLEAGGLTVLPFLVPVEKGEEVVEHLLLTSYPRYPAEDIFLIDPPYTGLSLRQASRVQGVTPEQMVKMLSAGDNTRKALLLPLSSLEKGAEEEKDLVAGLTGFRAQLLGKESEGVIKTGYKANLYFFKTYEYEGDKLAEILKKGEFPYPVYLVREGKVVSQ
ncbi:hypothetical protein BR63_16355 [Thermanaerosceptrum fracticalcis]|uniref:Urease alpha-subunit N-terminal domain-containing protein n=1 Tax=Thermanaerosceptrum fracticalcis TaxID=1712410 RepID=A0A7G6E6J8_THEFR|nr:hypothetical protein [Thermanaerosceptrum fracticalcis]QNB47702.1 hypothetical protein BR63_16355 [Thermanaerosceptrum fracticalcis]